jgi:hypothetical protein
MQALHRWLWENIPQMFDNSKRLDDNPQRPGSFSSLPVKSWPIEAWSTDFEKFIWWVASLSNIDFGRRPTSGALPVCTIEFNSSDLSSERIRVGIAQNIGLIVKYEVIRKFLRVA